MYFAPELTINHNIMHMNRCLYTGFCLILFFFSFQSINAADITGVKITSEVAHHFQSHFTDFEVYKISTDELLSALETGNQINLNLGGDETWFLSLFRNQMFSDDYVAWEHTPQGDVRITEHPEVTYDGFTAAGEDLRMTITDDFIFGMIREGSDAVYIEPVSRIMQEENANRFVVYRASSVVPNPDLVCGHTDTKERIAKPSEDVLRLLDTSTGTTLCRKVEIAQAYDSGMQSRYGSNTNLSTWNIAIWNVVNLLYSGAFTVDIFFEIKTEAFGPSITTSTDVQTYLQNFRAWGNAGGFGTTFDIGNLWTTVDVSGSVIGSVMDIPGVCGSFRYQLFEDFVGPTSIPPTGGALNALAILIAHEAGHNMGMFHNDPAGDNIMEPFLNGAATSFTTTSKAYLENTLLTLGCFSSCSCIEVSQVTPVNCAPDGSTYDLEVTVEHDLTSGTFSLGAGGVSSSQAYGANPQTVTLSSVPVGTTLVTAVDGGDGSCNFTATLDVPASPGLSIGSTEFCETENTDQNLMATFNEQYGSIELEVNGDDYVSFELNAQFLDKDGNVVSNFPFGTFANAANTVVSSGPLNLANAPYTVVVVDSYGDGMSSQTCFGGTEIDGDYTVRDGQGNIIYNAGPLSPTDCNGNDALSQTHTFTPAVDLTTSGNFTGTGVTDATGDDGLAVFNPATAAAGRHNVDYSFDTDKGCSTQRLVLDVYAVPTVTLVDAPCVTETTYDAEVSIDLGAWNSVLAGKAASISVSSTEGTLSSTTISASGNLMITGIPENTPTTVTIGDGTENGGCQATLMIAGPDCLLPVEWLSFEGRNVGDANLLEWATATETDNAGFEVWRKTDAEETFKRIGWVNGQGNAAAVSEYSFRDSDLENEVSVYYYQLKQVDNNGEFAWSNIVTIKPDNGISFSVFPNPTKDLIQIQSLGDVKGNASLTLHDALGRLVKEQVLYNNNNTWKLSLGDLAPGVYVLSINADGELYSQKVIRE